MPGLTSAQPVTDLVLWLRFGVGLACVLWLPGYLALGRHLRNRPAPTRHVLALSVGLMLLPLWSQATSLLSAGIRPMQYLPVALVATALFGTTATARHLARGLDADRPSETWVAGALIAAVVIGLGCIVTGFGDFVVPPTTHDAANHAYMTWRIAEVGTVEASQVFGPPHGAPDLPYTMGLQATAAMIAQTVGIAPYISIWFLALSAIALLPIGLSLLWDEWGLPSTAIGVAALLAAANPYVPSRLLWWGLFGTAAGLLLVPLATLLFYRFWSTAKIEWAVAGGMAAGSLMLIHGSELPTAGLLTLVTILTHRRAPAMRAAAWATFFLVGIVCGWPFLTTIVPAYLTGGIAAGNELLETLAMTSERTRTVLGAWPSLQAIGVFAIGLGLVDRRTRVLSATALAIIVVVTTLALWRDPVSGLLSTPYYRQPERVRYQLIFLVPALSAMALDWIGRRIPTDSWPRGARVAGAMAVVLALVLPELPGIVRGYEATKVFAPFRRDDFDHALEIRERVGPDEWVLNQFFDGSSWAMHVSGRSFLVPTGWRLTDPDGRANDRVLQQVLRGMPLDRLDPRFRYVYVSDLRTGRPRGFTRARMVAHEAFEAVLVGRYSTLYRIRRPGEP